MLQWSKYFQNTSYLETTRKFLINKEMQPIILKYCQIKSNMKILDVGCGTGFFGRFLLENNTDIEVVGLDADKVFIDYATLHKNTEDKRLSFIQGDALNLPFSSDSFDIVVSHTFFTSIEKPEKAMEEMKRVCKQDGYICSITAMSFESFVHENGEYPVDCSWHEAYKQVEEKIWCVYEQLNAVKNYINSLDTKKIPSFFVEHGLQEVSMYPIGKAFSLSNEAYSLSDRREYINTMYEADVEKLNYFSQIKEFYECVSKKEITEYQELLLKRRNYLLEHIEHNKIWEWEGGANCLITGRVDKNIPLLQQKEETYFIDTKYKDASPIDTVKNIKHILNKVGIRTKEIWLDSMVIGCYSVRIEIQGTKIGQNGKGMTKAFALASGYAELMERMQTGYLYIGRQEDALIKYQNFMLIPEEVYMSVEDVLEAKEQWFEQIYRSFIAKSGQYFSKKQFLKLFAYEQYIITEKDFVAIPFYHIKTKKRIQIPSVILKDFYATNGTCSGNTEKEAIVQGLSEIVERHHNLKIHNQCITPPDVPDRYLKTFPNSYKIIETIRNKKWYDIIIKDCSLEENFPVVATILIDKNSQSYVIKFGSHPIFEIALERSMTELFQGRNLENAANIKEVLYHINDVNKIDIIHNVLKNATGAYHYSFFSHQADYEFKIPENRTQMSNEQLYEYAVSYFQENGYDIYIRNASYLGFSTFQIIVPSYSEIYNHGIIRLKEKISYYKATEVINRIGEASDQELKNLLTYLKYKESFQLENTLSFLVRLPLNDIEDDIKNNYYMMLFLCIKIKEYKKIYHIIAILLRYPLTKEKRKYLLCMNLYFKLVEQEEGKIKEYLKCFCEEDIVELLYSHLEDEKQLIVYLGFSCLSFQCAECKNRIRCDYENIKEVIRKLKDYFKCNSPLKQDMVSYNGFCHLTQREQKVMEYYKKGYTRKEIAEKLYVSENTIKKYINGIYKKLGTSKRSDLYRFLNS